MNFSLSSAPKGVLLLALAAAAGCGSKDGVREYEQATAAYEVRDLAKAEKLFAKSLERAPNDVDRLVSLARVKLDLGQLPAAADLISKAVLRADGDSDVMLLAAQIAWHMKDYKAAADGFSALANDTKLSPAVQSQAWAGLGVVEMTRDEPHLARVAFLRAIRLDRRNAAAWYHLGILYRGFGYLEAALEQFEIFVRLEAGASPRVQKVQLNVIPALKQAIAQNLTDRPGASGRNSDSCSAILKKAKAEWDKGLYKNARQSYQQALAADPLAYPAALGLAKAWEKTDTSKDGQSKALENYKIACSLSPSAVTTYLTTGALAYRLGLYGQAVEVYSRAVAASPTSFDALDGLIRSMRKIGKKAAAAQAYQLYRESIPQKK